MIALAYVGFDESLFPGLILLTGVICFLIALGIHKLASIGGHQDQGTLGVIIFIALGVFFIYQSFHVTWN